ncbi:MAG: hypothetical protein IJG51_11865 [Synergistaceae bacterium]|nr:hypothetical protein [Synergistaceae bacterium]MBQ6665891.1 hypothetical protein [Synergistaceae bacterium]
MDETIQQSTYDVSADGAVSAEEPPEPEEATSPDPELAADGIGLTDGELKFGDEYFGDVKDSPEEATPPAPEVPKWYTEDELKQIPFETWDIGRLNGDVSKIAPIVRDQLQQRQVQRQTAAMQGIPMPIEMAEPKQYTPKELAEESLKLACEKLGIEDADDFDAYEGEHSAALEMARQELLQKRNAEVSAYQEISREWQDNLRFHAELVRQPDFRDFNEWYMRKCQEHGVTPQQMNDELMRRVQQAGNHYRVIPQIIGGWYQEYRQTKSSPVKMTGQVSKKRNPAVLEGTRGNNYGARRVNAREFGSMTPDEQAEALMQLGYV